MSGLPSAETLSARRVTLHCQRHTKLRPALSLRVAGSQHWPQAAPALQNHDVTEHLNLQQKITTITGIVSSSSRLAPTMSSARSSGAQVYCPPVQPERLVLVIASRASFATAFPASAHSQVAVIPVSLCICNWRNRPLATTCRVLGPGFTFDLRANEISSLGAGRPNAGSISASGADLLLLCLSVVRLAS